VRTSILLLSSKSLSIGKYADTAVLASHCGAAAVASNAHPRNAAATSSSGAGSPSLVLNLHIKQMIQKNITSHVSR
jgi:hypothetical protein